MAKYTTYELKIEPKYWKDVYRVLKIDGNNTLDDLCYEILSAFDFDNDHLYMFSLKRKKYDSDGYFHPQAAGGKNAAKISLNKLNLKVRNKFLFLYDFGDEWMFDITVKKIEQSDIMSLTYVKEQNGEISQYPDWEDESEDENENEEFLEGCHNEDEVAFIDSSYSMTELLSENKPSELKTIMKILGMKVPKVSKKASKVYAAEIVRFLSSNKNKLLELLTPGAAYLLYNIANSDIDEVLSIQMEVLSMDILLNLGLVDYSDEHDLYTVEVTKDLYEFGDFFKDSERFNIIKRNYQWQKIFISLMNLYGVAELEFFHKILCGYLKTEIKFKEFEQTVVIPMLLWDEVNVNDTDFKVITSLFSSEITEYILTDRNNFDILDYKRYSAEELSAVIAEGTPSMVPNFNFLIEYLAVDKGINLGTAGMFLTGFSVRCLMGDDNDAILDWCNKWLNDNSLKLTKKLKDILLKIIRQHPCAVLMGYSRDEYTNRDELKNNQISLFDDLQF